VSERTSGVHTLRKIKGGQTKTPKQVWGLHIAKLEPTLSAGLLKIKQRLGPDHCYLVRIAGEGVDVQLTSSGLEVDITERLKSSDLQIRKLDEHPPISGEAFKVGVTLQIDTGAHFLDLEIGHIVYPPAQSAFVSSWSVELKAFDESSLRQHL